MNYFGPSNSGHPQENDPNLNIFWGDIHQMLVEFSLIQHPKKVAPNEKLASGPQQEPFTSVVPVSVTKTFKTGSKWVPTDVQAICFEGNHAVLYKGFPLPNTLSLGRCDVKKWHASEARSIFATQNVKKLTV